MDTKSLPTSKPPDKPDPADKPAEKPTAKPSAKPDLDFSALAASSDAAVQNLLAERSIAVMNDDKSALADIDRRLAGDN